MEKEYWVYDPIEHVYEFFDDKDARDDYATDIIDHCKDDHDGLWSEEMLDQIKCGESITTHKIVQTDVIMRPDDKDLDDGCDESGFYWSSDYDYICDYKMKEIKNG